MAADSAVKRPVGLLSPRLLAVHLLAIVLIAGMLALGWWQSQRYDAQRAAASAESARAQAAAPPVALDTVLPPDAAFPADQVGVKARASGQYEPRGQRFVAGKRLRGRTGFWVLTPLRTGESAILVVRGWVAHPDDPAAQQVPTGPVTVTGWLQPPEPPPAATEPEPADDRVVSAVSTAALVGQLPYDLYSGYLVAAEQQPPQRALPAVPRPEAPDLGAVGWRNLAYAAQWWVFAAFVAFMWWRIVRDARVA